MYSSLHPNCPHSVAFSLFFNAFYLSTCKIERKIDLELKRFVQKKISPVDCTDPVLEDLVDKFFSLKSKLPLKENEKLHEQYFRTYSLYLKLIRLIMDIDEKLQNQ